MNDVAREAGVSLKTVSRAVNQAPTLDPALAARVFEAIGRLGYRRNAMAASLRSSGATATFALIIGDLRNPYYAVVAAGIVEVAAQRGTHLITASSEEDPDVERSLALDLCQRSVDGLLVVPTGDDQSFLQPEVDLGTPVVFLDRPAVGLAADTVMIDNVEAGRVLAERVLNEGHRRMAVLMDSLTIPTMSARLSGIRAAYDAAGMPFSDDLVVATAHDPESTAAAVTELIGSPDPPTAYFGANNRIVVGVVDALVTGGARARVVGVDDFEMSRLLPRPVTLLDYDPAEIGRRAAARLFDRIDGVAGPPTTDLVPFRLVDRGSYRP